MLLLGDLLVAVLIGIVLTTIFAGLFSSYRTWDALVVFFLAIFLFSWAGGVWITPVGPVVYDFYVFPFIFGGLLIALLMMAWFSAMTPPANRELDEVREHETMSGGETILAALGSLFWLYIIAMAVVIGFSYL